ncbi:ferredoxin reductase [Zhongshania aquimaris]|uniref:Ferredoxin reductase n=1 Tax=Zhongshania aquimaris TaxID=2857107 RepID=A0ABS6VVU8_9GAMM|nr:ferredoxin reductase [Zhongshania aquimaris]MBW2942454.1 ferredoxin reductase [Zhongshania aquimaris]
MGLATNTTSRSAWRRIIDTPLINALAAPHGIGRYLEVINPMWSLDKTRIPARISAITAETDDTVSIELSPNGEWTHFLPGQFVQVYIEIDGRLHSRSYSLSNSAYHQKPRITVKAHEDGFVSKYINSELRVGDRISISPAAGEFVLPADTPAALLFIAAGSGITPMMAMLETLFEHGHSGAITLLYYSRNSAECIFRKRLEELAQRHENFSLLLVYSSAPSQQVLQGHFNQHHLLNALSTNNGLADHTGSISLPLTYICGPAALIDQVSAEFELFSQGDKLHSERFKPANRALNTDGISGSIAFRQSQFAVENDGSTLLEQAESAGLSPQSGCRMGICHTCTCLKTSGTVRNINSGEISRGEEHIRLCISQAVGDVTLSL